MREISTFEIKTAVKDGFKKICCHLDGKVYDALQKAFSIEENPTTRFALKIMLENAKIAEATASPLCQDTGMAVVFLEIGQEVLLTGAPLAEAVNLGVREAYVENFFRKSVLSPLTRTNTQDNTPAVIHTEITEGDKVKLYLMAKGFGSENMSRLFMLTPSKGIEGVKAAIVQSVREAQGNPCPPVIVGVGVGGTMEKAALMSKKALFRELDEPNGEPEVALLEEQVLAEINALGIGAQGFGGKVTALKVNIDTYPTHLAGLPVAVSMQCYCSRHAVITL